MLWSCRMPSMETSFNSFAQLNHPYHLLGGSSPNSAKPYVICIVTISFIEISSWKMSLSPKNSLRFKLNQLISALLLLSKINLHSVPPIKVLKELICLLKSIKSFNHPINPTILLKLIFSHWELFCLLQLWADSPFSTQLHLILTTSIFYPKTNHNFGKCINLVSCKLRTSQQQ